MFFKTVMIGMSVVVIMLLFDVLLPKLKHKYRLHKHTKEKKQKREAFKRKMKRLEIK